MGDTFDPGGTTELWVCTCHDWVLSIGHAESVPCRSCGQPTKLLHRTMHDRNAIILTEFEMNGLLARLAEEMRGCLQFYILHNFTDTPPQWPLYEKLMYAFYTAQTKTRSFKLIEMET